MEVQVDRPVPPSGRRLVLRTLRRHRARIAGYVGFLAVWQVCEAMVPVLIGVLVDRGIATRDGRAFLVWAAVLVLLFVVLSYSYRFGARIGLRAMETEVHLLRMEITRHALDARGVRSDRPAGEVLSLATSDAEQVGYALRMVGYAVASVAAVGVAAVVLLRTDLVLGLVVLLGVPLCVALTQVATPAVGRRTGQQQERLARTSGVATDLVRGLRVLHGIGGEPAAAARYRAASQDARRAGEQVAGARAVLLGLASTLGGVLLAVVTLLAGWLALDGGLSVGELVAIVGLTQFLAEPIRILAAMSADLAGALASGQRIVDYLRTPPLATSGRADLPATGAPTLAHPRLGIESSPGELLGVVVDDPATAQLLVAGLAAEVSDGAELGGHPVTDLDVDARRRSMVVVPHRADLFEGTVRSNIDPTGSLDEAELAAVLAASAGDDVVGLRPGGLDEPVTPDGATYSGGQRQRIAMARALASRAPVLVLHDPTTAVDSVTEEHVAGGLRTLRGDGSVTTWLLTSSPALLEQTDRVVLVRDGRVVASGAHHDLLADPAYRSVVVR